MARYTLKQTERDMIRIYRLIEKYPYATANEISMYSKHSYIYTRKIIQKLVRKGLVIVQGKKIKKYVLNFNR